MEVYYTASGVFDNTSDETGWRNYSAWRQLPQLTEVISLDKLLNKPLVEPDYKNAEDWTYIITDGERLTGFYRTIDYVLKQVKQPGRFHLLAVVIEPIEECRHRLPDDFEFIGYDLLDNWYDISSLTNCDSFFASYLPSDINNYGLLDELGKAVDYKKKLLENNPENPHADTQVIAVWRHRFIGR